MLALSVLAISAAACAAATTYHDCVLAGPDFPSPANTSQSHVLSAAISTFEALLGNKSVGLSANDTAWGVALFSSKENKTLYEHYYTPPVGVGVKKVDKDSVFRAGSLSKIFTVWSFLIEASDSYFNDPITKYIPELAAFANATRSDDNLNHVNWNDVTIGELASHAAGIPRDPTSNDLSATLSSIEAEILGFPPLNKSVAPSCGVPGVIQPCNRKEMFAYLQKQHPIFATQHSPAYSNIAFTLLGYAQEAITGKPLNDTVTNSIVQRLGMKSSSYDTPPKSGGVIPGNNTTVVGWDLDLGLGAPAGSFYTSTSDLTKAGQAILQSSLLKPAETRRWLRPLIQTGYLGSAVGAPWEIRYLTSQNQHIVNTYNKLGDTGNYYAAIALSPQHDLGWVVLTGGVTYTVTKDIRDKLFDAFGEIFIPMAEKQARQEAVVNFNGTYVDKATNSSAVVVVGDDGRAGLGVPSVISRGREVIGPNSEMLPLYGVGSSARLYPSGLQKATCNGARVGFKATFFNETLPNQMEDPCLLAWNALGIVTYEQRSLDDWVFEMGRDGRAKSLDLRMLRLKLVRQE